MGYQPLPPRKSVQERMRLQRKQLAPIADRLGFTIREETDAIVCVFGLPEQVADFTLTKSDGMQLPLPREF